MVDDTLDTQYSQVEGIQLITPQTISRREAFLNKLL